MKAVVMSLKRLYNAGCITQQQVWDRVEKGTITDEEYRWIIEDDGGRYE